MKRIIITALSIYFMLLTFYVFTDTMNFHSFEIIKLPGPDEVVQEIQGREMEIKDNFFNAVAVKKDKKIIYISNEKDSAIYKLFKDSKGNWVLMRIAGGVSGKREDDPLSPSGVTGSEDGDGDFARFNMPKDICLDKDGNIWVADLKNSRVRKIICPEENEQLALPSTYTVKTITAIETDTGNREITPDEINQVITLDYNPVDDCVYCGGYEFSRIYKISVSKNMFLGKEKDRIGSGEYLINKQDKNMKKGNPPVSAGQARFTNCFQLCVDREKGYVYFHSGWDHFIFRYDPETHTVSIAAGSGSSGSYWEGKGQEAYIFDLRGLTWDPASKGVFIACKYNYQKIGFLYMDSEYNVKKVNLTTEMKNLILEPQRPDMDWEGNIVFPNHISDELIILKK